MAELLRVNNLQTRFYTHDGIVKAVNGVGMTTDSNSVSVSM